jgi:hypothetical protein
MKSYCPRPAAASFNQRAVTSSADAPHPDVAGLLLLLLLLIFTGG